MNCDEELSTIGVASPTVGQPTLMLAKVTVS